MFFFFKTNIPAEINLPLIQSDPTDKEKGRHTSFYFVRLGFPSMLEGIDRWLSEGPLPLFLPHVMQFRSLVEFIVSVYCLAEQSAIWLSALSEYQRRREGPEDLFFSHCGTPF